ncbi:MAG: pyridoxamine 5'-phosphate oxidase family protein [Chloroflexota bacterium]|nr:pyridoxamine 5'-phosphate oxidase family protein [Dehalococcoidia bacterium]MDW8255081.1 pyridoxamine 5'-phosphate oxidase family protein [Chloroflexota bacterium]
MFRRIGVRGEAAEVYRDSIYQFIQQRRPMVACFLTTTQRSGQPVTRQVGAFLDGWRVGTITEPESVKVAHIRRNPLVSYLWVELTPAERGPARNVLLLGECTIDDDPERVYDFLVRRAAARGWPAPERRTDRWLLWTTPRLVRAEGWVGGETPAILTTFPLDGEGGKAAAV